MNADGITLYVGDKPVEIYVDLEPEGLNYPVEWSFSNEEAVSLEASDDGMKCSVTVLQPKGKNELKVVCHNSQGKYHSRRKEKTTAQLRWL